MARCIKGSLQTLALSAAATASALAVSFGLASQSRASDLAAPEPLSLVQPAAPVAQSSSSASQSNAPGVTANSGQASGATAVIPSRAFMLDDAPETPNIHGFFESPFKTGYLTPRGLYVQNSGISWQPVVGLVFPLGDFGPVKKVAFVGGIWNAVDTYEAKSNAYSGPWDEMDVFASFSGTVADNFGLNLTYGGWNSPEHAFHTEHNLDLKFTYSDKFFGDSGFSINPYLDCWWAISGDSTVILGRKGGTGYFEPGIVPTYTYKGISSYPITFTMPTYFSVGPSTYWDANNTYSNSKFGLISCSLDMQVPLAFIPAKYGFWHADAGITYDYLINEALLHAGTLASGNTDHNCLLGSVGFGVNF